MSKAEKRGPPRHGQIKVAVLPAHHARKHLKMMVETSNVTRDYGGHSGQGQVSGGSFTGSGMTGGASGADYESSSQDSVGDADSTGSTGY
jgi:hypothetical protein